MRALEIAAFLTLSGALHVAALTLAPVQSGGSGGGDGGKTDVTMQPVTPTLAALVAEWSKPPEISTAPMLVAPTGQDAPNVPRPDQPVPNRSTPTPLLPQTSGPERPNVDTRLPAPARPLAQSTTSGLSAPELPHPAALPLPTGDATASGQRPTQPQALSAIPDMLEKVPDVDTRPPSGQFAPRASLRPALRPDVAPPKAAARKQKTATAPPQPAQKARGSGTRNTATAAPARRAPVAAGPSKAQLAQAQATWGARIRASVARAQRYPNGTRARGTVKVQIRVSPAGRVVAVSVVRSSGDTRLDQAALKAVKRARLPKAPKGLTAASYRFNLPLSFQR